MRIYIPNSKNWVRVQFCQFLFQDQMKTALTLNKAHKESSNTTENVKTIGKLGS